MPKRKKEKQKLKVFGNDGKKNKRANESQPEKSVIKKNRLYTGESSGIDANQSYTNEGEPLLRPQTSVSSEASSSGGQSCFGCGKVCSLVRKGFMCFTSTTGSKTGADSEEAKRNNSPNVEHECEDKRTHPGGCSHCVLLGKFWFKRMEWVLEENTKQAEKTKKGKKGKKGKQAGAETEEGTGTKKGHLPMKHLFSDRIIQISLYMMPIRAQLCHHVESPTNVDVDAIEFNADYDYFSIDEKQKFHNLCKEYIESLRHAHITENIMKELIERLQT